MNFYDLANKLGRIVGEPPIQPIDYVQRPRSFDRHTIEQVKADLRTWANEGDTDAAEALREMEHE